MHLYITFILPTITKTQQLNNVSCELYVSHREPLSLFLSRFNDFLYDFSSECKIKKIYDWDN